MVDVALFGESHIYQRPTTKAIYDTTVPFDPEGLLLPEKLCVFKYLTIPFVKTGLLGVSTSVLTAYLGAQAAKIILVFPANNQRVPRWFVWFLLTV